MRRKMRRPTLAQGTTLCDPALLSVKEEGMSSLMRKKLRLQNMTVREISYIEASLTDAFEDGKITRLKSRLQREFVVLLWGVGYGREGLALMETDELFDGIVLCTVVGCATMIVLRFGICAHLQEGTHDSFAPHAGS